MQIILKFNHAREQWLVMDPDTGQTLQELENCGNIGRFFNVDADINKAYKINVCCDVLSERIENV